jgi:CDP-paratose 2-epimerase
MSCIYGPHQCGTEDQGWLAHFIRCALDGRAITIYGDGKQVRDVLYVDDLCEAVLRALRRSDTLAGRAYNLGGGPPNTISLLELVARVEALHGSRPKLRFGAWRPADQRYYVTDTSRFAAATGWSPRVPAAEGVALLYRWFRQQREYRDRLALAPKRGP